MLIISAVINVNAEVNSGSLQGSVVGKLNITDTIAVPLENVTVAVYDVTDLVTSVSSTQTDENGDFLFQALSDGIYVLKISHGSYQDYESEVAIDVEVGVLYELADSIELLLL